MGASRRKRRQDSKGARGRLGETRLSFVSVCMYSGNRLLLFVKCRFGKSSLLLYGFDGGDDTRPGATSPSATLSAWEAERQDPRHPDSLPWRFWLESSRKRHREENRAGRMRLFLGVPPSRVPAGWIHSSRKLQALNCLGGSGNCLHLMPFVPGELAAAGCSWPRGTVTTMSPSL